MNNSLSIKPTRLQWVDWMKVLGMYFIIVGHTFPTNLCAFVYSFSVPLFFFLSGLLEKGNYTKKEFTNKCVQTLLIPYILICLINTTIMFFQDNCIWDFTLWMKKLLYITLGLHNLFGIRGYGSMWFVYTLIVIKIFFFLCKGNQKKLVILSVLGIIGALLFNHIIGKGFGWSTTNAMLSFSFYVTGYMNAMRLKSKRILQYMGPVKIVLTILILGILLFYLSNINGAAFMYLGWYGNYILLFYLCATLGIAMTFLLSLLLSPIKKNYIQIIASGNIIILGFHEWLLPLMQYPTIYGQEVIDVIKLVYSLIVLIIFIPIILIVKKICPILIGRR